MTHASPLRVSKNRTLAVIFRKTVAQETHPGWELLHLSKWRVQPGKRGLSWEASIANQRDDIADHLDDNPSLKPLLPQALATAYRKAWPGGGGGDGVRGIDFSRGVPVDGRAGLGQRVLADVRSRRVLGSASLNG